MGFDQISFVFLLLRYRQPLPSGLRRPRTRNETDVYDEFLDNSDIVSLRKTCISLQISGHGSSERVSQRRESFCGLLETSHLRPETFRGYSGKIIRIFCFINLC